MGSRSVRNVIVLAAIGFELGGVPSASVRAINITVEYDEDVRPSYDPDGSQLTAMFEAAALLWEDLLPGFGNYSIDFSYEDRDGLGLWTWDPLGDSSISIDNDPTNNTNAGAAWWFDPTPLENSEFDFVTRRRNDMDGDGINTYVGGQWLGQDLTTAEASAWYSGSVPALFEIGARGFASTGPAAGMSDIFSTVVHELGHELGINLVDPLEGDWEINPQQVGGANFAVQGSFPDGHIAPRSALMCNACGMGSVRRLPSATDVLAIAEDQGWSSVDLRRKDFTTTSGAWQTPFNWFGNSVPDGDDDATIRTPGVGTITLFAQAQVENLTVIGTKTVDVGAHTLFADNSTNVLNSAIVSVGNGGLLFTGGVQLAAGGQLTLSGSGQVIVSSNNLAIDNTSLITGSGVVDVTNAFLNNDGIIRPTGGGTLFLRGPATGDWLDLDGPNGTGVLNATVGNIQVNGRMVGTYDTTLSIGGGRTADFRNGFALGSAGTVRLLGSGGPATLAGAAGLDGLQIAGTIDVAGGGVISADVQFGGLARVRVDTVADTLEITGASEYANGTYSGDGTIRQTGPARVVSSPAAPITRMGVDTYDWDGAAESTATSHIISGAVFHIASQRIENGDPALDGYDGTAIVDGQLVVDTLLPWRLDGTIALGAGALLDGSEVRVFGAINTGGSANGPANVGSDLSLQSGWSINVSDAADALALNGTTSVMSTGTMSGAGLLRQVGDLLISANLTIPTTINYDWDGEEAAPSYTLINPNRTLTLNAETLDEMGPGVDGHDGAIDLLGNLVVNNPSGNWRFDGTMNFFQSILSPAPVIGGSSTLQLYGTINSSGLTIVDAPIVLNEGATVNIPLDTMRLLRHTTFAGGNVTSGALVSRLDQRGDATVTDDSSITIARYDWDGIDATPSDTTVQPSATFTLNIQTIDPDDSAYDGNLNIDGGAVVVNLPGAATWRLDGRIDVGNNGVAIGSVDGSKLISHGTIAARGIGRIDADLEVTDAGVLRVDNPTDTLFLSGFTTYRTLAAFAGTGTLVQSGDALVSGPTDTDGVNVGIYDMDGNEAAPAEITILFSGGPFGADEAFVINARQIERGDPAADGFDGTLRLTQYVLEVNTAAAWRLDGALELVSVGGNLPRVRGADIDVHGTIRPVGRGRMQAAVHFQPTAIVNVEAGEVLHFDDEVSYNGGTYTGLGTLEHNVDIRVTGNTSIDVAVFDMDGSLESTGVKVETGSLILNVNRLDVADNVFDGGLVVANNFIVNTPTPWTTNGEIRSIATGTIAGAPLVSNGPLVGAGLIKTDGLTNNGGIFADNGTLTVGPGALDLDGSSNTSRIEAISGNLVISQGAPTFRGTAVVGIGRTMTFVEGWTADGTLNLSGDSNFAGRAILAGALSRFESNNTINVTKWAEIAAPAEFHSGTTVNLPDDATTLHLSGGAMIEAGARFNGAGTLVNLPGSTLSADDGTSLGVVLQNQGVFQPGGSAGQVRVPTFDQLAGGTLEIEIGGRVPGDEFDQLLVGDAAKLGGELVVDLIRAFEPDPSDMFTILSAATISGMFDNVAHRARIDTLGGEGSFVVTYDTRANIVTLSDFLRTVLLGDYNNNGAVDAADFVLWRKHLGSGTALANDETPGVGPDDYTRWRANFGRTAGSGSGASANAAVPEPGGTVLLVSGLAVLAWARKLAA